MGVVIHKAEGGECDLILNGLMFKSISSTVHVDVFD